MLKNPDLGGRRAKFFHGYIFCHFHHHTLLFASRNPKDA
jgi:hypothetical protein